MIFSFRCGQLVSNGKNFFSFLTRVIYEEKISNCFQFFN